MAIFRIIAFLERLLTGERPEPTYLITKPFNDDVGRAAIGQIDLLRIDNPFSPGGSATGRIFASLVSLEIHFGTISKLVNFFSATGVARAKF